MHPYDIIVFKENYFDRKGKVGIINLDELKNYILNIYKTLMYRGIKGTFIFVKDEKLRGYFEKHIITYQNRSLIY